MAPKTYFASCHCGNIKYNVTLPEALSPEGSGKINKCNCSICTKNGYLLVYPERTNVVFLEDSESRLKDYYMGKKVKPHRFCPECSSSILIDFKNVDHEKMKNELAMNSCMFEKVDLEKAEFTKNQRPDWYRGGLSK